MESWFYYNITTISLKKVAYVNPYNISHLPVKVAPKLVQPFQRLTGTDRQTDRQTDKTCKKCYFGLCTV